MTIDILRLIDGHGGALATHEAYSVGFTRAGLATLVASGHIRRIRQGWFVRPGIDPRLAAAACVGGRLTCANALDAIGAWALPDRVLHIAVDSNACQLRSPRSSTRRLARSEALLHWHEPAGRSRLLATPIEALADLCHCAPPEIVRAGADSLLRLRPGLRSNLATLASDVPSPYSRALGRADGICESGTETLFDERMRGIAGIRRQVEIGGIGRVDFLIGDRLVVEIDGFAYHSDPAQFESDRRRDAALSALGYRVLRFSYRQVLDHWGDVELAVRAAIARRDHF